MYYERRLAHCKSNNKATWKIVYEIIGKKKTNAMQKSVFKADGLEISYPTEIANRFCEYFTNIGINQAKQIQHSSVSHKEFLPNSIFLNPVEESEIIQIAKTFDASKAAGYDSELVSDGHLFADDTNLTFADSNPDKLISVLNDDLKTLQNWLNLNKLSLNAIKTKCMFMASRQKLSTIPEEPNIAISGNKIERVRSYKCLGLKLDESLTWEHHVSTIISKVSKVIGVLRRLKPLLPQSTLTMIYNSLAQPYFDYCSIVWDSLGKGLGQKLQRLQNRAARIITESDYNIRSSDILTSLNWTNLETRRTQQFKTFMYKTVNNMVPSYLSGKFTSTSMIHEHSLRGSNHKLFVPRPLTESLKKSFSYRGATLWNDIPVELTSVQSLAEFKSKIS